MASLPTLPMNCFSAYQMTKKRVDETFGTFVGKQKYMQGFGGKTCTKEITSKT